MCCNMGAAGEEKFSFKDAQQRTAATASGREIESSALAAAKEADYGRGHRLGDDGINQIAAPSTRGQIARH